MSTQDKEFSDVKVDIALIKQDVKQIEKFFEKVDVAVDGMAEISKSVAVQQQIIENFQQKLENFNDKIDHITRAGIEGRLALKDELDDHKENFRLQMLEAMEVARQKHADVNATSRKWHEERHRETIRLIENIVKDVDQKHEDHDKRLRNIENLKWWILGAIAAGSFIAHNFDISTIMS